jgi:hypothetical protein
MQSAEPIALRSGRVPLSALITQLAWSLWIIAFSALGILLAIGAREQWDPTLNPEIPSTVRSAETAGWLRTCVYLSMVPMCLAVACAAQSALCFRGRRIRSMLIATCFGTVAAAGPMLIRIVLPWEDPYSGQGSPLATAISIVALGMLGATVSLPGLVVAWIASRAARRSPNRQK